MTTRERVGDCAILKTLGSGGGGDKAAHGL